MTADLEKRLAVELAHAALSAPVATSDLSARIESRYRRRRRRGLALASAATVAVVATGSTIAVGSLSSTRPVPAVEPSATPTRSPAVIDKIDKAAPPITEVWPHAVHTVPLKLPDGQRFHPELFLDDDTVLVRTDKDGNADRPDGLWAYNLDSGTARRLVRITPPPKTVVSFSFVAVGSGQLAWWTVRKEKNKLITDIWAAPITGGSQRKVTSFEEARYGGIDMTIAGGKAVWSRWGYGGVYQVPLSGGTPTQVPGTEKHDLVQWPWAGFPRPDFRKNPPKTPYFGHLINVQTGEQRSATAKPGEQGWQCAVTWCVRGRAARHRDGSGERELPGVVTASSALPALGRFLVLLQNGAEGRLLGEALYDFSTGRVGGLGLRPKGNSLASVSFDYRAPGLFSYSLGGKQVIVNLNAIR